MTPLSADLRAALTDRGRCPRCDWDRLASATCPRCGADLGSSVAREVLQVSLQIAGALAHRESLIARLPDQRTAGADADHPRDAGLPTPPAHPVRTGPGSPTPGVSVQSVLAVAGAALVAVAASVFTFLNPDLTDAGTRSAVIALVTVAFVGGAAWLARRRLRFSAEAVAGLAVVFLMLDVWALSRMAAAPSGRLLLAAAGAGAVAVGLLALARSVRLRVWSSSGLATLAAVPAMVGAAGSTPTAHLAGGVAVGFVTLLTAATARRLGSRFGSELTAELRTSAVVRSIAVLAVVGQLVMSDLGPPLPRTFLSSATLLGVAVLCGLSARRSARAGWSIGAGMSLGAAVALLPSATAPDAAVLVAAAPLAAAVALGATTTGASRLARLGIARPVPGAVAVLVATAVPAMALAATQLASGLAMSAPLRRIVPPELGLASAVALVALAGGLAMAARHRERADATGGDRSPVDEGSAGGPTSADGRLPQAALWSAMAAAVTAAGWSGLPAPLQIAVGLGGAVVLGVVAGRMRGRLRLPPLAAAHVLLVLTAALSFAPRPPALIAGALVLAATAAVARNVPARVRPAHVGVGFAYALVLIPTTLSPVITDPVAAVCLTTSVAAVVALAVTVMRRLSAVVWHVVLAVTAAPFLVGVVSVLVVRSGWTALSTAVIFALALTLVLTRRPGMTPLLRTAASALLAPALAVVVVCLGAQLLTVSGSPVVLPVVAAIVAVALTSVSRLAASLVRRGLTATEVRRVRWAAESTTLLTGAIAVLLSLVRAAAGLPTSLLVLLVLAVGGALSALVARRPYGWALAGGGATGALWCALALLGTDVAELYLLPPALGLLVVGSLLTCRDPRSAALVIGGLALSIVPTLVLLGAPGALDPPMWWRSGSLLAAAAALTLAGAESVRRGARPLLSRALLLAAIAAAGTGPLVALRLASATAPDPDGLVMMPVLVVSAVAAAIALLAGRQLVASSRSSVDGPVARSPFVPAALYLVAGPIVTVRAGWLPILSLLALTVMLLVIMLVTVARARSRRVAAPPAWFLFALAWVTAVAGWSERELRVEAFSLPLGAALLGAGVLAATGRRDVRATATSWPIGFTGSWRLLLPGLLVTLAPSMLATATDPLTWRAILVIAIALAAVLVGSVRRLAAPFVVGIAVLPIENAIVFAVQIGRSISAAPWWITLATAGAALLVIAVGSERRGGQAAGIGVRDLG